MGESQGQVESKKDEEPSSFDGLWMRIFSKLVDLCVDPRIEVRKSAIQTLFSAINTHGHRFAEGTWSVCTVLCPIPVPAPVCVCVCAVPSSRWYHRHQCYYSRADPPFLFGDRRDVLWEVLFATLQRVKESAAGATEDTMKVPEGLMVHHSRNTAAKQWAETRVLALNGVARVITNFHKALLSVPDFLRAWSLLLETIEEASGPSDSVEISLAAMQALQELVRARHSPDLGLARELWGATWQTWTRVAARAAEGERPQKFLAALMQCFHPLYRRVGRDLSLVDTRLVLKTILRLMMVPDTDSVGVSKVSGP